jgi:CRISPR-associated protein Cas2
MWVMVMFDLPVGSKEDRKNYSQFRKKLLENGFRIMQYSVYARPCFTDETAETYE